jgi:hypothetical protein
MAKHKEVKREPGRPEIEDKMITKSFRINKWLFDALPVGESFGSLIRVALMEKYNIKEPK